MKFQLLSDIHIDFHRDRGVEFISSLPVAADTLVIAGDTSEGDCLFHALSLFAQRWNHVVVVNGNHDHYNSSRKELYATMNKLQEQFPNLHWLNSSSVEIEGVRFHGTTLWFPNDPMNPIYAKQLADFHYIPNFVPWVYAENKKAVSFLRNNVKPGDVIVTHHLPSYQCVSPEYRGSSLNRFYVCDIESVFRENQPSVSVFGHTHTPYYGEIHGTRLYANPLGYPHEGNTAFNNALVIEV